MVNHELVYKLLKRIESGNPPKHHSEFEVEFAEYANAAEHIRENYLATNIGLSRGGRGNPIRTVHFEGSELTQSGKNFISRFESK